MRRRRWRRRRRRRRVIAVLKAYCGRKNIRKRGRKSRGEEKKEDTMKEEKERIGGIQAIVFP